MAAARDSGARRSHTHRKRKQSSTSRQDCDDETSAPPSHNFDRPSDIQDLRDARLKSMQTPARERRKMKIEYTYERPVKAASGTEKASKRPPSIFGFGTSAPSPRGKAKRPVEVRSRELEETDEGEYVYDRPRSDQRGRPTSRKSMNDGVDNGNTSSRAERKVSSSQKANRRKMERRQTEPAVKRKISVAEPIDRPPLRKSTTMIATDPPAISRPSVARAVTEVGSVRPSAQPRKSSILGNFLAGPPPSSERKVACLTCGSDDILISKSAKLPCGHRMCHSCLKRIFKMSITDPAHMPPRCCTDKHIDLKHVDALFDQEFKKVWNRKFKEYNAKNRIYCPRRGCGEWIQPKHMTMDQGRKIGRCPKCKTYVCGICNQKAHRSKECPKDPTTKAFVEVAKEKGWQRCYNCSAMVELKEGCNHMTCRCTAEFCMVCGLQWKSCDCPWFNYEAVDEHLGNPVRYQEELDRRRDQERRDEEFARRLQRLGIRDDGNDNGRGVVGIGNAAGHHLNQNFVQQAREALTANYQNAEQAARGLLNGFFMGRENPLPGFPEEIEDTVRDARRPGGTADVGTARRRQSVRRQNAWQAPPGARDMLRDDHDRRIRDWANGVDTGI